jgi:hypothetical protein
LAAVDVNGQRDLAVTLPVGASLRRVAAILREAWMVGPVRWNDTRLDTSALQEAAERNFALPTDDVFRLFHLLRERCIRYLLVGGVALLKYLEGRNTKAVDLIISLDSLAALPEIEVLDRQEQFVHGKFRTVPLDLLLTIDPLFRSVQDSYATVHRFEEIDVPCATVEGLVALKLYALPALYRQMDLDRAALHENDVTMLLTRYQPALEPVLALLAQHVSESDSRELKKIAAETAERAARLRARAGA